MADGDVDLELCGEVFTLRCTVEAFKAIPSHFDGFVGAFRRLGLVDAGAVSHMIAIGTGKGRDMRERERISDKLFEAGMDEAVNKLTEWIGLLSAGGKKREESGTGK